MDPAIPLLYDALEHDAEFRVFLSAAWENFLECVASFETRQFLLIAPNYHEWRWRSWSSTDYAISNRDHNYEIRDESHTLILINLTRDAFPDHRFESLFKNLLYLSKDCIRLNLTAVKRDESSSHFSILGSILISQKFFTLRKRMGNLFFTIKVPLWYRSYDIVDEKVSPYITSRGKGRLYTLYLTRIKVV